MRDYTPDQIAVRFYNKDRDLNEIQQSITKGILPIPDYVVCNSCNMKPPTIHKYAN